MELIEYPGSEENSTLNGKLLDRSDPQGKHLFPAVKESSTLRGVGLLLSALQIAYQFSDLVN